MLSPKQYRKLKSIQLFNGTKAKDYNKNTDLYKFFLAKGLIKKEEVSGYTGFVITPEGELELHVYKLERFHFVVPTVLSIIAIIASFITIFTQNGELWQWMKELLQLSK